LPFYQQQLKNQNTLTMTKTDTDTDTDAEVTPPAGRFVTWFALAAFNVIALVALNSQLDFDLKDESQEHKWCISSMIITLTLAVLGVVGHSLRKKFIGTPIEGGLVSIPSTSLSFLPQITIAKRNRETTESFRAHLIRFHLLLLFSSTGSLYAGYVVCGPSCNDEAQQQYCPKQVRYDRKRQPLLLQLGSLLHGNVYLSGILARRSRYW
jgi:hypothetical protein